MFFPVPDFKGFDFFPHNMRLPFMRFKGLCFALSIVAMALSLGLYFTQGLNYGVDFKGGSLIEVQHKNGPADLAAMRTQLNDLGLGDVQIQSFGSDTDVLIRVEEQPGGDAEQQVAMKKVVDSLGSDYTQRRIEVVGPAVSAELRRTGIIAVFASLLAIFDLRLVPLRMAVRRRLRRCVVARRSGDRRDILAVPARVRPIHRRRAAHHSRLLGERLGRRVRPHP